MPNVLRCAIVAAFILGCVESDVGPARGNAALGIASFTLEESETRTTVSGLDARGAVVGRLELIHGPFRLTGIYRDDYDTDTVVGRQLYVSIAGQELVWETAGFLPVMHMPAHPPDREALAAFLADPHVKPVLDRWGIGFEPHASESRARPSQLANDFSVAASALHGGPSYVGGVEPGTFVLDCSEQARCGTARGLTINTCGNSAAAHLALRITQQDLPGEDLVAQCCPPTVSGLPVPQFAIKVCPTSGTPGPSGLMPTSCGETTGACKGCPGYPVAASALCHIEYDAGALWYCTSDETTDLPAAYFAQLDPPQLWPPNHNRVTIDLASCLENVHDSCNPDLDASAILDDPSFTIDYVGSDEPGDGDIAPAGPHAVRVVRERDGRGDGRVYHVGISYTNHYGLESSLDCQIGVPHDRGRGSVARDSWVGPAGDPANPGFVVFDP